MAGQEVGPLGPTLNVRAKRPLGPEASGAEAQINQTGKSELKLRPPKTQKHHSDFQFQIPTFHKGANPHFSLSSRGVASGIATLCVELRRSASSALVAQTSVFSLCAFLGAQVNQNHTG